MLPANFMLHATGIIWSLLHKLPSLLIKGARVYFYVRVAVQCALSVYQRVSNKRTIKKTWSERNRSIKRRWGWGPVGDRNREKCHVLDQASEQMDTPQRRGHNRDVTTLGLKSPQEHKGTHAQWHESRSLSSSSLSVTGPGCGLSSLKGFFFQQSQTRREAKYSII